MLMVRIVLLVLLNNDMDGTVVEKSGKGGEGVQIRGGRRVMVCIIWDREGG